MIGLQAVILLVIGVSAISLSVGFLLGLIFSAELAQSDHQKGDVMIGIFFQAVGWLLLSASILVASLVFWGPQTILVLPLAVLLFGLAIESLVAAEVRSGDHQE